MISIKVDNDDGTPDLKMRAALFVAFQRLLFPKETKKRSLAQIKDQELRKLASKEWDNATRRIRRLEKKIEKETKNGRKR